MHLSSAGVCGVFLLGKMRRSVFLDELLGSVHIEMLFAKARCPPRCHAHTCTSHSLCSTAPAILHLCSIPGVDEAVDCEVVVVVVLGALAAAAGMEGAVVGRGRSCHSLQLFW